MADESAEVMVFPGTDEALMRSIGDALMKGDLSGFTPRQELEYYSAVCKSVGVNPLTKPFDYLTIEQDGKTRKLLYPNKECGAQLRTNRGVKFKFTKTEIIRDGHVLLMAGEASLPDGRTDESIAAVPLVKETGEWKTAQNGKRYFQGSGQFRPLSPEALSVAYMRCETKLKRRLTFSICGLGMADPPDEDTPQWDFDVTPPSGNGSASAAPPEPPAQQPQAAPPPPPPIDPELEAQLNNFAGATREQRLQMFQQLKADLDNLFGDEGVAFYYDTLKANSAMHAHELKSMTQGKRAFSAMWNQLRLGKTVEEAPPQ